MSLYRRIVGWNLCVSYEGRRGRKLDRQIQDLMGPNSVTMSTTDGEIVHEVMLVTEKEAAGLAYAIEQANLSKDVEVTYWYVDDFQEVVE